MEAPSLDTWIREAKDDSSSEECGMYLFHNGIVRKTAKARVRDGNDTVPDVLGMHFSYDPAFVEAAKRETLKMDGIRYVRVWLNEGVLNIGDDIMLVLVGGDIRPHVVDALQFLVGKIKNECVMEKELF